MLLQSHPTGTIVAKNLSAPTSSTPSATSRHPVARNRGLLYPQDRTFKCRCRLSGRFGLVFDPVGSTALVTCCCTPSSRPGRAASTAEYAAVSGRDAGAPPHARWEPRAWGEPPPSPQARACQSLLGADRARRAWSMSLGRGRLRDAMLAPWQT